MQHLYGPSTWVQNSPCCKDPSGSYRGYNEAMAINTRGGRNYSYAIVGSCDASKHSQLTLIGRDFSNGQYPNFRFDQISRVDFP
jgi:hypothetical protein